MTPTSPNWNVTSPKRRTFDLDGSKGGVTRSKSEEMAQAVMKQMAETKATASKRT